MSHVAQAGADIAEHGIEARQIVEAVLFQHGLLALVKVLQYRFDQARFRPEPGAGQPPAEAAGAAQFARRYGFLDKPLRIRFRLLDPALPTLPGCAGLVDITLDAASFATLALPLRRVVVTENETNFLALPALPQAIAIFGAGYGWDALARAGWLQRCELHYWGDIDTHGFAILDQLRGHFPHAASLLMDRETLLAHRALWGEEPQPIRHDLPRLTVDESAVYDDLRFDRLQPGLRLEQERVGFGWVRERLGRAIG